MNAPIDDQDLLLDPYSQPLPTTSSDSHQHPQSQPRRPRGFAATAAAASAAVSTESAGNAKGKREREKEKERTKLRERHRRAITSRMLAGLRQYGNFPLPARADMNDVLASLAREAGWIVEADGTTYRRSPHPHPPPPPPPAPPLTTYGNGVRAVQSPTISATSLKNCSVKTVLDCQQHPALRMNGSLSPAASLDSVVISDKDMKNDAGKFANSSPINSVDCLDADQLLRDVRSCEHGNDFEGSQYVPVYVMLADGFVNNFSQLIDQQGVRQELSRFKSLAVDGIVVNCWWGIVEAWNPQKYIWSGYREIFHLVREFKLNLQVVMAFHEHGGNGSGEILISLPQWVLEIGKENQDIFFTDREGRRSTECLSWGVDKERVLRGRTGIEVYFDFMRSFRTEFDDLFVEGLIAAVEISLGASGELRYPSFPERMGWRYPGIECYDKYLQQSLQKAAKSRGHSVWARSPDNAGQYNSRPHETGFFCERGDYDSCYGRFFLRWYTQLLISHANDVLSLASLAFDDTKLIVKIPAVYWWYKTASHAAELTAGFYNPSNKDGYSPVFDALKKHSVVVKLACPALHVSGHDDALSDPEGLNWQVLNAAWDQGLTVAGTNMLSCYDREGYMKVVDMAKPKNNPDNNHFSFFIYHQPSPLLQGTVCFPELDYFIKCMHGEVRGGI
ncbi:Beta-amylase 8 [Linum perenne]